MIASLYCDVCWKCSSKCSDFDFCTLIVDYTDPDSVCVFASFAPAVQSPPGITDPSQVDSTPLGG